MKKAALYVRVSTEEQKLHGYSVQAQKDTLTEFCQNNGYQIADIYNDEGISARKPYKKRPELLRLLSDVEAGAVDTILFCKLDRWFRSVKDYYSVQAVLDRRNIAWRAILEDYETETAGGRFKVNIMLAVAENEADRTSERIKFVFENKRARGELRVGVEPFGIRCDGGRDLPDPETAHIVRKMFDRYIELRSARGTAFWLADTYGIKRSANGVRLMLGNGRYLNAGIVDRRVFERAQEISAQRATRQTKTGRVYLFAGLMYCPECGGRMAPYTNGAGSQYYRCGMHGRYGMRGCVYSKTPSEKKTEKWVVEHIAAAMEDYNATVTASNKDDSERVEAERKKLSAKMDKLTDLYLSDLISREKYGQEYKQCQNAIKDLDKKLSVRRAVRLELPFNFSEMYYSLDTQRRKAYWNKTIKRLSPDGDGGFKIDFCS